MNWFIRLLGCRCDEKDVEIETLKYQIEELNKTQNIIEPTSYSIITLQETWKLIVDNFGVTPYLSDEFYNLTSVDEASKFTQETKVQYRTWLKEGHDCDNFSFASMGYWSQGLKSFAYGIAWSSNHAFNIMIDNKKKIWIIEPQTNKWMTIEEAKKSSLYYPIRLVLI